MSDDDFLPPFQYSRTQSGNDTFRSQSVTSSSANRNQAGVNRHNQANPGPSQSNPDLSQSNPGSSHFHPANRSQTVISSSTNQAQAGTNHCQTNPGTSQPQPSQEEKLSQIQDGIAFLLGQVQQLTGKSGVKTSEKKPFDETPNAREPCQLCSKTFKNKMTLFRHYRAIHGEMNPEKYLGISVNSTVINLDDSVMEIQCAICGYVAQSQSSLDNHNRATHSTVAHVNANESNNKENVSNNDGNNVKDKMHKCEECACYFEERSKFDDHMKVQHGCEVVCKICNKNFLFKDIDAHVKDSHPEVYNKKNTVEKKEKTVIEKVMKNKEGKRIHVFVCTQCDRRMSDKMEAEKHSRGHKKGLKIKVAPRNRVPKSIGHLIDLTETDDLVLFTCDSCNVSSGSYDAAVEHSQNHLTNMSYGMQCVTQTCPICEFVFEPMCFKKHTDLHYNNKEIHKESFKHSKYKFQFLLTEKWFECFDMTDPTIKSVISASIYIYTRSVKMRVMGDGLGLYRLYKCCQCNNFVEPAAVLNHTMNYDTCLKVKSSHACDICDRKFNNRLARDRHAKDHNSEVNFKVVIFNNERDKEFNRVLNDNDLKTGLNHYINTSLNDRELHSNDTNNNAKVVYKCLCGLCLIRKETADVHKKVCPGKDPKKPCPKCNNLFVTEELLAHCFEHHLKETTIIIKNITPDVIVIDSDEELEDRHDAIAERGPRDKEEKIKNEVDMITVQGSSEDELSEIIAEAPVTSVEQVVPESDALHEEQDISDEQGENHDFDDSPEIYEEGNNEMKDDDSQDTITYENTEKPTNNPVSFTVNRCDEIKIVPINQLLSPFFFENNFSERDIGTLKKEITSDIEIIKHDIETITESLKSELFDTVEEKSCWLNPTDFSKISRRPSLKQIELPSAFSAVESLLTDDEDDEMNTVNETENDDIFQEEPNANTANNAPTVSNQRELCNEITATLQYKDINLTDRLTSIEESIDGNMNVDNENFAQEHTDPSTNKDCEVNINDISNVDLSSLGSQNNKSSNSELITEKVISSDINTERLREQVLDSAGKETSLINNITSTEEPESRRRDSISTDATETSIGVIIENCVTLYADNTEGQKKQNVCDRVSTERDIIQTNNDDDTLDFEETDLEDTLTNDITLINNNESLGSTSSLTVDTTNIKTKFFDYTNIKIKTELLANVDDINNGSDNYDLSQIKVEPTDALESESNLNEGNSSVHDDDVKNCVIC